MKKVILPTLAAAATAASFAAPDAQNFLSPRLARLIFFHLPCAIIGTLFLFLGTYFALRYLGTRNRSYDVKAHTAVEIATILSVLAMATGILFSKMQWGEWWSWDPRQTSFMMVLLILGGYFALRSAFVDDQKRALSSSAYVAASALPCLFLIFVFPRLPQIAGSSFHPTAGGFDATYRIVLGIVAVSVAAVTIYLYKQRVHAGILELQQENIDERMADRGNTAAVSVVRPVSLSQVD